MSTGVRPPLADLHQGYQGHSSPENSCHPTPRLERASSFLTASNASCSGDPSPPYFQPNNKVPASKVSKNVQEIFEEAINHEKKRLEKVETALLITNSSKYSDEKLKRAFIRLSLRIDELSNILCESTNWSDISFDGWVNEDQRPHQRPRRTKGESYITAIHYVENGKLCKIPIKYTYENQKREPEKFRSEWEAKKLLLNARKLVPDLNIPGPQDVTPYPPQLQEQEHLSLIPVSRRAGSDTTHINEEPDLRERETPDAGQSAAQSSGAGIPDARPSAGQQQQAAQYGYPGFGHQLIGQQQQNIPVVLRPSAGQQQQAAQYGYPGFGHPPIGQQQRKIPFVLRKSAFQPQVVQQTPHPPQDHRTSIPASSNRSSGSDINAHVVSVNAANAAQGEDNRSELTVLPEDESGYSIEQVFGQQEQVTPISKHGSEVSFKASYGFYNQEQQEFYDRMVDAKNGLVATMAQPLPASVPESARTSTTVTPRPEPREIPREIPPYPDRRISDPVEFTNVMRTVRDLIDEREVNRQCSAPN